MESHIQTLANLNRVILPYSMTFGTLVHVHPHAPTWDDVIGFSVSGFGCCESRTFLGRMYNYCRQAAHPYRWLIQG